MYNGSLKVVVKPLLLSEGRHMKIQSPAGNIRQQFLRPLFGCRLFAYTTVKPYDKQDSFIRQCLLEGDNALKSQSKRPNNLPHEDACGVTYRRLSPKVSPGPSGPNHW